MRFCCSLLKKTRSRYLGICFSYVILPMKPNMLSFSQNPCIMGIDRIEEISFLGDSVNIRCPPTFSRDGMNKAAGYSLADSCAWKRTLI